MRVRAPPAVVFRAGSVRHGDPTPPSADGGPPVRPFPPSGPVVRRGQPTLTALHAAATALCCAEPAPYRSRAALSVAVRAWAYVVPEVM